MRQMLTESLLIALMGGAAGAARGGGRHAVLVAMLPAGFPRAASIRLNGAVFAFTFAIAVGTGLLFGLVPALQAARFNVQQGLREGGRGSTGSGRQARLRSVLVVGEVALACILLIGAGLMLRSFVNLLRTDPGFHAPHVLTATVSLPSETYRDTDAVVHFYDRILAELTTMPGCAGGRRRHGSSVDRVRRQHGAVDVRGQAAESERFGACPLSRRVGGLLPGPWHSAAARPVLH